MGAESWDYFVPYEEDLQAALEKLRQREFEAGRYRYSHKKPMSIARALRNAAEDGTASILDVDSIAPEPGYSVVAPLAEAEQIRLFGTSKPTRAMIEANMAFYEGIKRGQGVYIIAYEGDEPSEIFFGGYSYD